MKGPLANLTTFLGDDTRYARLPEYVLSLTTMAIGVVLVLPATTLSSATFTTMLDIAPETVWGLLIATLGMLKLAGVRWRIRWLRRWTAFVACAMWLTLGISFFLVNPYGLFWIVCVCTFALINALTYLRMGHHGRSGRA